MEMFQRSSGRESSLLGLFSERLFAATGSRGDWPVNLESPGL